MNTIKLNTIGTPKVSGGNSGGNGGGGNNMAYYANIPTPLLMSLLKGICYPASYKNMTYDNIHMIQNMINYQCVRAIAIDKNLVVSAFNDPSELVEFSTIVSDVLNPYEISKEEYFNLTPQSLPRIIEFSIDNVSFKCYEGSTWNGLDLYPEVDVGSIMIYEDSQLISFNGKRINYIRGLPAKLYDIIEEGHNYVTSVVLG
jgi:hypothetical protein